MAVKYNELMDKLENSPLTASEIRLVNEAEELIDKKILSSFKGSTVQIDLEIATFTRYDLSNIRRSLMTKELQSIYEKAGWECKIQYGEDDGPNRPGYDYWELKGKK